MGRFTKQEIKVKVGKDIAEILGTDLESGDVEAVVDIVGELVDGNVTLEQAAQKLLDTVFKPPFDDGIDGTNLLKTELHRVQLPWVAYAITKAMFSPSYQAEGAKHKGAVSIVSEPWFDMTKMSEDDGRTLAACCITVGRALGIRLVNPYTKEAEA